VRIGDYDRCLEHLTETDRRDFLAQLGPGAKVDVRRTPFSPELLEQLLDAG
jgi:hypothetical protein